MELWLWKQAHFLEKLFPEKMERLYLHRICHLESIISKNWQHRMAMYFQMKFWK